MAADGWVTEWREITSVIRSSLCRHPGPLSCNCNNCNSVHLSCVTVLLQTLHPSPKFYDFFMVFSSTISAKFCSVYPNFANILQFRCFLNMSNLKAKRFFSSIYCKHISISWLKWFIWSLLSKYKFSRLRKAEVVKTEDKNFLLSHPRKRTTSSPKIENHSQTVQLYAVWNTWRIFSTRPLQKFRHINLWSQVRGATL